MQFNDFVIAPNLSNSIFSLRTIEGSIVKVIDVLGRGLIEELLVQENYQFGSNLSKGAYIVSLINGEEEQHKIVVKE